MNADYNPESPEATRCKSQPVGVGACHPSPTQPRKRFNAEAMEELTASVREHGVIQPIIVRPWPGDYAYQGDMPLWEIVAGERRWRAARAAGLALIPAMVRGELTHRDVGELQLIENLQREDVLPTEEAEGYQRMISEHGYSADDLAAKVGKSRAYIYGRLKLTALCVEGAEAIADGSVSASVALRVARIPSHKLQVEALGLVKDRSARDACAIIRNRFTTAMHDAPWDLADAELVATAGACADCPKRTGNMPELFKDDGDVCTDPNCFAAKRTALGKRQRAAALAAGNPVIEGNAAREICCFGSISHNAPVVALDKPCYAYQPAAGEERKTARELLADHSVPITLVEDPDRGNFVETVDKTAMAKALKAAGVNIDKPFDHDARNKRREAQVKAERNFRERLLADIRHAMTAELAAPGKAQTLDETGLRLVTRELWKRLWGDSQRTVARYYQQKDGKLTNPEIIEDITARIDDMPPGELVVLAITCVLANHAAVHPCATDLTTPDVLLGMARDYLLNPDDIRRELKAAGKPARKGASPAKAPRGAKKAADKGAGAKAPAPTKAARAAGREAKGKKQQAANAAREKEETSGRAGPAGDDEKTPDAAGARGDRTQDIFEEASA